MNWIFFALLIYTFIGSLLIVRTMRGLNVQASPGEWIVILFLWPICLRFFAQLSMVQAMIKELEHWSHYQDQEL
jgi:hypothetical protein